MLPDQETLPTADDADQLQRALYLTNSKFYEVINQQTDFEKKEQEGFDANLRVEEGLRKIMFIELGVIVLIGIAQYFLMRSFVNKVKRM